MGAKIDKARGRAKQAAGVLTGSEKLKQEGEADELKGKVKGAVDGVKDAAKGAKDAVKRAARKAD